MNIHYNKFWDNGANVRVSIITPVYNRRDVLPRSLKSVEAQTFRQFEHIIINDGSDEPLDDIVVSYMDKVDYPVAYIKKNNGGVHTARNAGVRISRGELIAFLDSDDEFLPECLMTYVVSWDGINAEERKSYSGCTAFCMDQTGKRIGGHLPANINKMPYKQAQLEAAAVEAGEKHGVQRGDLMRSLSWPEPEGVKLVLEGVLWAQLDGQYKTWFLDDCLRIYHTETAVSYTSQSRNMSNQNLVNTLYNQIWSVDHAALCGMGIKQKLKSILKCVMVRQLLKRRYALPEYDWVKKGFKRKQDRLLGDLLWLPSLAAAWIYVRTH